MIRFLKNWTLPISMVIGALFYKWIGALSVISPALIFTMLLLTFCKVRTSDLRLRTSHFLLLAIEILGAITAYYLIAHFNPIVAQAIMVCVICPTATAAAVVTNKLHGNVPSITTYTLLCNVVVAIIVPAFFPIIYPQGGMTFWLAFWHIIRKVFPLLIFPFIVAQLLRRLTPKFHARLTSISDLAFYMWAIALTIAMGIVVKTFITDYPSFQAIYANWHVICGMLVGSLIACSMQFFLGKAIGRPYADTIAAGQSLGQKNTVFAIWMASTFLAPVTSLAPGMYIVWQNIFNSWQLYRERKTMPQ
ncbi:MAG: transporter [Paludibacteraceae bacterium]|nr:transporter [Paludibacteraceae bacterium]